ncbi:MAG: DUF1566 domain-containing protein, partial [bacterium]|nr:DUF1566 domain-containing protein [bacterium]
GTANTGGGGGGGGNDANGGNGGSGIVIIRYKAIDAISAVSGSPIVFRGKPSLSIGQALGGGYYAGRISTAGNGIADYALVVAPKATGQSATTIPWGTTGVTTGITSVIAGPTNSAALAAIGNEYEAATYCEGLSIGGNTDWYLPAQNELEVVYYFLKPETTANSTGAGSNANAVPPEPISTNHTAGSPARTSASLFQKGQSEAFNDTGGGYWTSTENAANYAMQNEFQNGAQANDTKTTHNYVRCVRRVEVSSIASSLTTTPIIFRRPPP